MSFIAGARSLTCDEEDLRKNLQVFKVPQAGIDTIRSRLAMKIYDECANVLRGMYSVRFTGTLPAKGPRLKISRTPKRTPPPFINTLGTLTKLGNASQKRRRSEYN